MSRALRRFSCQVRDAVAPPAAALAVRTTSGIPPCPAWTTAADYPSTATSECTAARTSDTGLA